MANNQNPQGNYDPAGSTQMFRAFVDEGAPQASSPAATPSTSSGPRVGLIAVVVAVVVVVAAVAWLAFN
ncbi:hypothetical protein [Streptomyces acidiscabies]|uniref:Uncharacterized protein n=1 Tax=Streptomyces acidiscabies TaxID=42234 RepID=A0AAP6EHC0_9ACTN|nr:hypothetical protein [Streptomyces acidiscabies]MBZ3909606.1 hypothetical protein [Streptomyces acidiscabies]MDX2962225.1 hypothetical protein [Streptomyces acidiscabies]MDX3019677.1 hypothetical protein [Streptomyces acidiscabies]MDX3792244.1 hypothetical protein [Streptomyces acidiscabies]GAV45198.1 hypothetical protein Saa2_08184 [Streptomyces acidiscabies]